MAMSRRLIQVTVILTICSILLPAMPTLPASTLCISRERDALLAFKAGLTDPGNYLSSWRGQDCCQWNGIECSIQTGHVVKLEINGLDTGSFNNNNQTGAIGGKVNSSLLALQHLQTLDLSRNNFGGISIPEFIGHISSLRFLDLSHSNFSGRIPCQLGNLSNLKELQLNFNNLYGRIPPQLGNLSNLNQLWLDSNNLHGRIPPQLGNLSNLEELQLSSNNLHGRIPPQLGNLSNLKELWLNSNNLHGIITEDHFANMTSLKHLWISENSLTMLVPNAWNPPFTLISAGFRSCVLGPQFPAWLGQPFYTLDISNTSIHDSIPGQFWIGNSGAQVLDLSRNKLVGRLPTYFLFGDLQAVSLDISSNQLVGPIPMLPKNLVHLDLSGNNLSGTLPSDIGAPMLRNLILFKNSISGALPCSLLQLQHLEFLDLSENLLNGTLPDCLPRSTASSITMLNLNNNNLSGTFPLFLQKCKELIFLDLAYNNFFGTLPSWMGEKLPHLSLLRLRSNMFSGGIPTQLTRMKGLQYLDLAYNNFTGNIPRSLGNLRAMTLTPDNKSALFEIVHFGIVGVYLYMPVRTDSLLVVTKGQQLEFTTGIAYMVNIDLSCNSLTGQIPEEIAQLVALKNLNLSWNHLSSKIPSSIGGLQALESFDLSHNELSGEIPSSMSALTSLIHLNLSYNHLCGTIPSGNQLRTLDNQASIYIGNPGLCGPPLPNNCSGTNLDPGNPEEKQGMSDSVSFYISIGVGWVVGLWTIFIVFLLKRKWRIVYFSYTDRMYDWFMCKWL